MSVTEHDRQDMSPRQRVPRLTGMRKSRRVRILAAVVAVIVIPVAWSLGHALTAPGTDSVAARIAEWGRTHHAGALVTWLERVSYRPPKVGGRPGSTSPLGRPVAQAHGGMLFRGGPPTVVPPARPPLPGEGTWHVLATVRGRPALEAAYVRPDAVHTSYTAGIVWISSASVRAVFHPGYQQPGGGPWRQPPDLHAADRHGLLAAFNSAFRLQDARGGFYADGRYLRALRPGAASLVVFRDGRMTVGAWGRDVRMGANVAVVRQNLPLIVEHRHPVAGLGDNTGGRWGYTIANADYVWRSGLGVTAHGDLVYVAGNRLSAQTLADLLSRAGAVRAMELDINPDWTSFILYRTTSGTVTERNLLPDMQGSARRYDEPSSRDFVALYAR